eukprot:scaffold240857_cov30-Tisochrysis_lutea.AAC.7
MEWQATMPIVEEEGHDAGRCGNHAGLLPHVDVGGNRTALEMAERAVRTRQAFESEGVQMQTPSG